MSVVVQSWISVCEIIVQITTHSPACITYVVLDLCFWRVFAVFCDCVSSTYICTYIHITVCETENN